MKYITRGGLALIAICALGATVSTAAQAGEAPYYGIESKRLGSGESREITATQISEYMLTAAGTGTGIACKKSGVIAGATINGSSAGEPGTGKETLKYEGCTISTNGEGCQVGHSGSGEIRTESLKTELVYDAASKESKSVAVEFTPETGAVLSKITLFGASCSPIAAGVLSVEGQVVAQAWGGKTATEFLLELGKAVALGVSSAVKFPATAIKSIVLCSGGTQVQKTVSLSFAGIAAKFTGESEVKLTNGKKWGVGS